jgi:hypothetical protein
MLLCFFQWQCFPSGKVKPIVSKKDFREYADDQFKMHGIEFDSVRTGFKIEYINLQRDFCGLKMTDEEYRELRGYSIEGFLIKGDIYTKSVYMEICFFKSRSALDKVFKQIKIYNDQCPEPYVLGIKEKIRKDNAIILITYDGFDPWISGE